MKASIRRFLPWVAFALGLVYVGAGWLPRSLSPQYDFDAFGKLPVQVGGRIKPLDSVARNSLLILSERQKAVLPENGGRAETSVPALVWLVEMATRPEVADTMKVFRVLHPGLRDTLGIRDGDCKVFSYLALQPHFAEIDELRRQADPEPKRRDSFEKAVMRLHGNLTRYHRLLHSCHPLGNLDRITEEYDDYQDLIAPGLAQLNLQQRGETFDKAILDNFMAFADRYLKLSQQAMLRIIPPEEGRPADADWENVGDSLLRSIQTGSIAPPVRTYAEMTEAYRAGDAETFNAAVGSLRSDFRERFPGEKFRVSFEYLFNAAAPFYRASVL